MPEHKIGVAISANDNIVGSGLVDLIANYIYDTLINNGDAQTVFKNGVDDLDIWANGSNTQLIAAMEEITARPSKLSEPLESYVGVYSIEDFGTIVVSTTGSPTDQSLHIRYGNLSAVAQAGDKKNSIRFEYLPLQIKQLAFNVGRRGNVESLKFEGARYDKQ